MTKYLAAIAIIAIMALGITAYAITYQAETTIDAPCSACSDLAPSFAEPQSDNDTNTEQLTQRIRPVKPCKAPCKVVCSWWACFCRC